jgi:hypothetical protein|tara:strand:- start:766 stop:1140 length:375 start_codon:yes stop_codon:yes gene_type:complete
MKDTEKNIDQDYKAARETYHDLIEKGREGLEYMMEIAKESEHPRAFEVLATMIKTISDTNGELMKHNKIRNDINKADEIENPTVTNNNLFVGTTTELQKMLQNNNTEDEVIDLHEQVGEDDIKH